MIKNIAQFISLVLSKTQSLEGIFHNKDVLESSFNLVNDGVVILDSQQKITKINKSAEIMFNTSSKISVGK